MQLRAMAMARWVLPVPVETASQCRVSGVRRFDPLSVPSSGRADGAGRAPQALRRRGPSGRGAADGTLALIPAWMSEDIARSATLTASPRLAVGRLVELRARIDALIASQGGAWPPREGGDRATKTPLATEPVRGGSQDAGYSDVAEKHSRPPDRGPAGRGPRRR